MGVVAKAAHRAVGEDRALLRLPIDRLVAEFEGRTVDANGGAIAPVVRTEPGSDGDGIGE
jgi:hypothetical protein